MGVRHPERLEDAGPEELVERDSRGDLGDRAQDVGRVAVDPAFTGLGVEGKRSHAPHRFANRLFPVGEVPAGDLRFGPFLGGRPLAVADPRGMGEQVPDGDRPPRRHDVVGPIGVGAGDRGLPVFREIAADRVRDQQPSVLLQDHDGHAHERLGLGSDPKDVVDFERVSGLAVAVSEGLEVDGLPATCNERYRAGKGPGLDIALESGVEPGQPVRVQSGRAAWGRCDGARAREDGEDPSHYESGKRSTEPLRGVVSDDSHGLLPSGRLIAPPAFSLSGAWRRAAERTRPARIPGGFRRTRRGGAIEEGVQWRRSTS